MATIPDDINSEEDLKAAVDAVGAGLQEISHYLSANPAAQGRVRFPRGFLGTVGKHSKKYGWIEKEVLKRNLSYQYIFYDVLRWVSNRTDVSGTASEMIYKHAIVVISSIAEGLLAAAATQLGYVERKYPTRLKHLLDDEIITSKLRDELTWMWSARQAVHVHIVDDLEWEKYKVTDARRASKAVKELEEALDLHFSMPPF